MDRTTRFAGAYPHSNLTKRVIGAAMEVHRELGPGFLEKVYHSALAQELSAGGIDFVSEAAIPVLYKNQPVGVYYADLLVDGRRDL